MSARQVRCASAVAASLAEVWARVTTMAGVNEELAPIRMSVPRELAGIRPNATVPVGVLLFTSVVSIGGVLPRDLHRLELVSVTEGVGFHERFTSLLQRRWEHRRTLTPTPAGGTLVEDVVDFDPPASSARSWSASSAPPPSPPRRPPPPLRRPPEISPWGTAK